MASAFFPKGFDKIIKNGIDGMSLSLLLISDESGPYVYDAADEFVADVLSGIAEAGATNYARKTAITDTVSLDLVNGRVEIQMPNQTWASLGGATNQDISSAILYDNTGANDAARPVLAHLDLSGTTNMTNGTDFTLNINAEGLLQFNY